MKPGTPNAAAKKISRGKFLRNSVITASGIALVPSIFSSCKKYEFLLGSGPGKGWGGVPTQTDLQKAAANLILLRQWIIDVYDVSSGYELTIFFLLDSTKADNSDWSNFISNLFIDIGIGTTGAVADASPDSQSLPALACLCDFLKDWNTGQQTPRGLAGTFKEFIVGHNQIKNDIAQKLASLVDPANNYSNLLTQWKDVIEFNGKSYTLSDLADSVFPGPGDEYNKLQATAFRHHKKSLWNLVMMKCCSYYENYHQYPLVTVGTDSIYNYVRNKFYPFNKGVYARGHLYSFYDMYTDQYELIYYNLGIGGYALPDAAAAELFIDDMPGHVINSAGLWNRSYVFQQFSLTKPEFLGKEFVSYPKKKGGGDFVDILDDNWVFTGGLFPRLIQ